MSEHLPDVPVRRGRRDPELEAILEAEEDNDSSSFQGGAEVSLLDEGNMVMARVTLQHPTAVGDGWFTFGTAGAVRPGETEQEAAGRLYDMVTESVYGLIDGVTETVEAAVSEQKAQKRQRRIPTNDDRR